MPVTLVTSEHSPGLTPQIVRTPSGGLALQVQGHLVHGALVLGVGPDTAGKFVASIVIDLSKAAFCEANAPLPTLPPMMTF